MREWLLACAMVLATGQAVQAADLAPVEPAGPEWHGDMTVYGWLPSASGQFGFNGNGPYDIPEGGGGDSSLFDVLDGFFMGNASLRRGRLGVFGDIVWADFGKDAANVNAGADLSGYFATAAVTYTIVDADQGHLDAFAGARWWSITGGAVVGGLEAHDTFGWTDPVVGLRGRYLISPSIFISATGAIGGFGVGTDFMWDAAASVGYNFNSNLSISIGYRGLGLDYAHGGDMVDIVAHGPVLGLTARF